MQIFKTSLVVQMAIATVLCLICGLVFGDLCDAFTPYAGAYIMLLKVTAIPYLMGAIIHGIGQLSVSQAKLTLRKGVLFLALAWGINVLMIYGTYFIFPKPQTTQPAGYLVGNAVPINFFELLIPENIFYDLSNNIIPSVVVFALLVGISLMYIRDKQTIMSGCQNLVEALTRITGWIARITPIGTFIIIASKAGTIEFSTIKQVSTYLILYILCLSIVIFWIFPKLISMLTHIPSSRWLKQLSPILLIAYTTNVVIVCLPYIVELLKKETLAIDPFDEKAQTQIQGTVSVAFNLPMGSLFITLFIFFISLLYQIPLGITNQAELFITTILTGLGAIGIGSWVNTLTFLLDSLGLPQDALSLFLTTLPFTSGFQAMTSAMQITSLSLLIILASRKLLKFKFAKIAKKAAATFLPILLLFGIIKAFNPLPEVKHEKTSIFELAISSNIPVTTYKTSPSHSKSEEEAFDRILSTKVLRVGYFSDAPPFSFYNVENELVGYNIAFAYALAHDLGCALEFIPIDYSRVGEDLAQGTYDIALSALSIDAPRLKNIYFTDPYLDPEFVFVTHKDLKKKFSSLSYIKSHSNLSIAVLKGTSYEGIARNLFPDHKIILLNDPNEFMTTPPIADALFWIDSAAIAWATRHHNYKVAFPSPNIGKDSLAYGVSMNSPKLLNYLNQWLELKKTQGYSQTQYDLWMLEKTEIVVIPPPRWSLLRYLGWAQ
jgi:Na+/H+-dicarboxylate symporter/ABC-type amino acid transport substrate-binding protein